MWVRANNASTPTGDDMDDSTARLGLSAVRVARPTTDLPRIRAFYELVVGLSVLWSFTDHDGFDGVIFGLPDEGIQLELVRSPHGDVPAPSNEDVLVLYVAAGRWSAELVDRLREAGTIEIQAGDRSLNPYWPANGAVCFADPDGYRLIVVPAVPEERTGG